MKPDQDQIDELTGRHNEMPCPNCQEAHGIDDMHTYPKDGDGEQVCARPDVQCRGCGAYLRHTVPLFMTGAPWHWTIVRPAIKPIPADFPEVTLYLLDANDNPVIEVK